MYVCMWQGQVLNQEWCIDKASFFVFLFIMTIPIINNIFHLHTVTVLSCHFSLFWIRSTSLICSQLMLPSCTVYSVCWCKNCSLEIYSSSTLKCWQDESTYFAGILSSKLFFHLSWSIWGEVSVWVKYIINLQSIC